MINTSFKDNFFPTNKDIRQTNLKPKYKKNILTVGFRIMRSIKLHALKNSGLDMVDNSLYLKHKYEFLSILILHIFMFRY